MRALVILILLWPGSALAGAWPRTPGEIYLSTGQELGEEGWTGLYAERGGPGRLTFGLDVGGHMATGLGAFARGEATVPDVDGRAIAFVRVPLSIPAIRERFPNVVVAAEFGLGADFDVIEESEVREDDGVLDVVDFVPRARIGLSVGRPLSTPLGDGWVNVDARVEPGGEAMRYGFGLVAGVRPRERLTVEMGVFVEIEEETYLTSRRPSSTRCRGSATSGSGSASAWTATRAFGSGSLARSDAQSSRPRRAR